MFIKLYHIIVNVKTVWYTLLEELVSPPDSFTKIQLKKYSPDSPSGSKLAIIPNFEIPFAGNIPDLVNCQNTGLIPPYTQLEFCTLSPNTSVKNESYTNYILFKPMEYK